MKTKDRQFVTLRTETRSDNHKATHIVTWNLPEGGRMRRTFSDPKEAANEADRVEALFAAGYAVISKIPRPELVALALILDQMAPGTPPYVVGKFYLEHHHPDWQKKVATVGDVGKKYLTTRQTADFSARHQAALRYQIDRFIRALGTRDYVKLTTDDYQQYLDKEIGGSGKTRQGHLIALRAMSRWARDVGNGEKFLPPGATAAEGVTWPKHSKEEHEIYTPEEFIRLLIATPRDLLEFQLLGQLAGVRSAERCRMFWHHWRDDQDHKLVLGTDVTKTEKRRRVDVLPSLDAWLTVLQGKPDEPMVRRRRPHKYTAEINRAAGVPAKDNALRAGYASYHLELFDDPKLTAKNDGHSVEELETTYKAITGVTKKTAKAMLLDITPAAVLAFAKKHNLPTPEWAPPFTKKK